MTNRVPLSLYVHIPWCVRKCPYCDFNSHEKSSMDESAYITALLHDLAQDKGLAQGRPISSIFFGGGTPSLFSAQSYDRLLQEIHNLITIENNAEITLEANPGTFEYQKFKDYHGAGINRLSIGVQSFETEKLATLGRIHNTTEAITAARKAREAGFDNINIDLMHGLPDQTPQQALADLNTAMELQPTHLSWYQLTIEPNTAFYSKPPILPVEETLWRIEQEGKQRIHDGGYVQYETSAYSKPNKQCQHNLNYWQFGDYMAIGAGAHGKITHPESREVFRYQKTRLPKDYLNAENNFTSKQETIAAGDLAFEFFMNAFRLHGPISKSFFTHRTFLPVEHIRPSMEKALKQELVTETEQHWQTTDLGNRFLNTLLQLFT